MFFECFLYSFFLLIDLSIGKIYSLSDANSCIDASTHATLITLIQKILLIVLIRTIC